MAGLVLLVLLVSVIVVQRSAPPEPPPPQGTPAPVLVAHGRIVPARQARVGTLGGGVVRQLRVMPGAQVGDRAEVARVDGGSNGVEIVTAPFAGAVTNVLVHEGDTVLPGAVLLVVADPHTLQVETSDVDEFLVSYVHVGQPLQVTVDTLDNLALQGVVKSVAGLPQPDANGGSSYPVIIGLDSLPPRIVAGMSIRVTFPAQ